MDFEKEMSETRQVFKSDKVFSMPLPTLVEGETASGDTFQEKTILSFISHRGAVFHLKNQVAVGSRLRLAIDLPRSLSEDKSLKLVIRGHVILIEKAGKHKPRQRITMKFENKYFIKENT